MFMHDSPRPGFRRRSGRAVAFGALLAGTLLAGCSSYVDLPRRAVAPENALLILNGEPLALEDFDDDFRLKAIHYSAVTETEMRRMKRFLSEQVIDQRLLCQEARRLKVRVTRREFERALKAASQDSPEDFPILLKKQGVTVEAWKRGILMKLMVDKLAEREVYRKVEITPREVEEYYWAHLDEARRPEMVRARHLVVRTAKEAAEADRRLADGQPFEKVAAEMSVGPARTEGGLWEWMRVADLPALYAKALSGLAPGEVSGRYRDGFGYHRFQLVERRPEGMRTLAEMAPEIREKLTKEEQDYRFDQWLTDLKEKADIRVNREMAPLIGEFPEVPVEKSRRKNRPVRRPVPGRP